MPDSVISCPNRAQGLEGGRESRADRYGDMARLGGTCSHLLRESPPADLDHSPVPVPLLEPGSTHHRAPRPDISLSEPAHLPCYEFIDHLLPEGNLLILLMDQRTNSASRACVRLVSDYVSSIV